VRGRVPARGGYGVRRRFRLIALGLGALGRQREVGRRAGEVRARPGQVQGGVPRGEDGPRRSRRPQLPPLPAEGPPRRARTPLRRQRGGVEGARREDGRAGRGAHVGRAHRLLLRRVRGGPLEGAREDPRGVPHDVRRHRRAGPGGAARRAPLQRLLDHLPTAHRQPRRPEIRS